MTIKKIEKSLNIIWVFIFILIVFTYSYPESSNQHSLLSFRHLGRAEGMQNSIINCIYQDRKGFIFIGTRDGLHLYDGNKIRVFSHNPQQPNSLPSSKITAIVEDPDSNFVYWIGTDNGLCRFDMLNNSYRIYFKKETIPKRGILPSHVSCLYVSNDRNIWVGLRTNGIKKYDTTTRKFIAFKNDPYNPQSLSHDVIKSILEDDNGNLWVVSIDGVLNKYNPNSATFTRYTIELPEKLIKSRKIKRYKIWAVTRGKNNILWLGFYGGILCRYNLETGRYTFYDNLNMKLPPKQIIGIQTILEDHTGTLWIGTMYRGLIQFDPVTGSHTIYTSDKHLESGLSSHRINTLFEDKSGNLWIGTKDSGVDRFLLPQKGFHNKTFFKDTFPYLDRSRIFAIVRDRDSVLWLGFVNGGLLKMDLKTGKSKYYYGNGKTKKYQRFKKITSLLEDSADQLWVGTLFNGVMLFDKRKEKIINPTELNPEFEILTRSNIITLYEDLDGDIWIGTSKRGLFHFDRFNNKINRYIYAKEDSQTLSSNMIRTVMQDSAGYIWVGTKNGLDIVDKYNKKIIGHVSEIKNLKNFTIKQVNTLFEDVNNEIWIGTGRGLIRYNPRTKEGKLFNEANGFPSNRVVGILADSQNNLWISTSKGIVYLNIIHNTFLSYTAKDGLLDDSFNNNAFFNAPDGIMYFGHHDGITYFNPFEIEYGRRTPEIVITGIKTESSPFNDQKAESYPVFLANDSRLEFPWSTHTFYIEFAILDYTNPAKNYYAYKIEGLESKWRFLNNRNYLSLINLPPGEYPIRITGVSSRGVWNEKGILLNLVILPPFWQTWWFRISMAILLLLIAYLIFYIRMKQVKKRNKELEQINTKLNEQISVRRHVENMLRISEEKYKKLVSSLEHYIVSCDREGIITFINEALAARFRESAETLIGQSIIPRIPEERREEFKNKVEHVLSTGISLKYDAELERNMHKYYFHIHIQPLKEDNGLSRQVLIVVADVTHQRNLEDQLRQSQKMEAIGKLAGGIAHDFNNLIAIIRGYSDLILSEIEEKNEWYESILEIDKAGERAAALVRQLLAFSRRQILQPKVIDVNLLIRDMEKMLNRLIRENIELWFRLDPDLGNIYADPGQIEQVIMNLVLNARDAMPKGGKISIETKKIHPQHPVFEKNRFMTPMEYIMVEVRDTGLGIKKEYHSKIFDPFFTTKKKGEGTGLGLSTVFGIVKQSKGYILLESEEGKGTSFKLFFPKVNDVISFSRQSVKLTKKLQGTETILVVEDEQSLRVMICKMLKSNGYKVLEAADGEEALAVVQDFDGHIDLLLTDVVMPGMSGRDLAERITEEHQDMAVLYMSGYTDDEIVHQGILFQDTHFIQKPFTPEALGVKIRETLKAFKKTKARL
ncbi:MAG TPA: response regulator [Caldithrix abyssi]|uniref:histidine kinase n=1 Tax=Caldithrix abyssi TaxID=187145 RepID=A0A7V4TXS9_CALAY|nr:response regulator [Caldithrix abyssi]